MLPKVGLMLPRVLVLSSSRNHGGADRHTVALAAAYQAHDGTLCIACPPDSFTEHTSHTHHLPTIPFQLRNSGDLRAVLRLVRLLRSFQANVLHSHARRDFVTATLAGKLARCPVILHVHVVRPLGEPLHLAGHFFSQVEAIIAVSDFAQQELERWHPLRKGLVRRIYNGIETKRFLAPSNLRTQWMLPDDAIVIGMVGRLTTKGQYAFIPVAATLAAQFPKLHFVFIGPDALEFTYKDFQQALAAQGLQGRSLVVGMSDQIPAVMHSLDILVHLPREEAFGLALAEAGAACVPVVATRIGGCTEVVEDGKTGFLVKLGDDVQLLERLQCLLTDPLLRQCLGQAAQRRVHQEFSAERQITELCSLYKEVAR
ncbi:glycosyltransferase family 4 protein [Armatimonas sp.]|uniref:glycosyltransferase family 4 protein n=1 Tax=Armatimonas sp. TaxID=1872638 RepID=UPI00374D00C2